MSLSHPLRFITYLSPSLPHGLFAALVGHVGRVLGAPVTVTVESATSGPPEGEFGDPFSTGAADIDFLCAPL